MKRLWWLLPLAALAIFLGLLHHSISTWEALGELRSALSQGGR